MNYDDMSKAELIELVKSIGAGGVKGKLMPGSAVTPEMLRAAQLSSELGRFACANLSGAYGLIEEMFKAMINAAPVSAEPVAITYNPVYGTVQEGRHASKGLIYELAAPVAAQAQPISIDRKRLRALVDVVWNEATESTVVPDSPWADRLIDKVFGATPSQKPVSGADGLTSLVDAAMTEMKGIHPPLKRSDCARLIGAALAQQDDCKADAERWISVNEHLPEIHEWWAGGIAGISDAVLTVDEDDPDTMTVQHLRKGGQGDLTTLYWDHGDSPTHWRPAPSIPGIDVASKEHE